MGYDVDRVSVIIVHFAGTRLTCQGELYAASVVTEKPPFSLLVYVRPKAFTKSLSG
jgi:hypothetical protein